MADYISREAAIEALCKTHSPYPRRREISVRAIQEIPTANVRPVVKSRWIEIDDYVLCANCGVAEHSPNRNYCHNCGCAMGNEK